MTGSDTRVTSIVYPVCQTPLCMTHRSGPRHIFSHEIQFFRWQAKSASVNQCAVLICNSLETIFIVTCNKPYSSTYCSPTTAMNRYICREFVSVYLLGENSLTLSQDSGAVDQYFYYKQQLQSGLTHSTKMKVKQISQTSHRVYILKIYLTLTPCMFLMSVRIATLD